MSDQQSLIDFESGSLRFVPAPAGGLPPLEDWVGAGRALAAIDRGWQWALGDWYLAGERWYGEDAAQGLDETELAYKTVQQAAWVAGRIPPARRRLALSWSHHREVAALDDDELQDRLLDRAEREGLSTRELARAVRLERAAIAGKATEIEGADSEPLLAFQVGLLWPRWPSDHGKDLEPQDFEGAVNLAELRKRVPPLAPDAALVVGVPPWWLLEALALAKAWGFEWRDAVVWERNGIEPHAGHYVSGRAWLVAVFKRGDFPPPVSRATGLIAADVPLDGTPPKQLVAEVEDLWPEVRAGLSVGECVSWAEWPSD